MDNIWGFIHDKTDWEPSERFVNGIAGLGDGILATMSFEVINGKSLRKKLDIG